MRNEDVTKSRHDENGNPLDVRMLDLAVTRWMCPATDLVYFFFVSTTPQFRRDNEEAILRKYHEALEDTLEKLDILPEVYTLRQGKQDLKHLE